MKNITDIDTNFKNKSVLKDDIKFYNVRHKPFQLYGFYKPEVEGKFRRIPEDVAASVSDGVRFLSTHTSGGRIRFKTDSQYIVLKTIMSVIHPMPHMTIAGSAGFDIYVDGEFTGIFMPTIKYDGYIPTFDLEGGYEGIKEFPNKKMRDIIINFPLYDEVDDVFIGVSENAVIENGNDYSAGKKVVFYGSSITQGGCATRPGNSYQNILSRWLDFDFLNLGFSGNAKGEPEIAEYIANLDMDIFVYDYDFNAPSNEHFENTHYSMYKTIRNSHPDIPIIMLSRPTHSRDAEVFQRIDIIEKTIAKAKENGDYNVYFLNGHEIFKSIDGNVFNVDGCHPNDFGFYCMAKAIENIMKDLF